MVVLEDCAVNALLGYLLNVPLLKRSMYTLVSMYRSVNFKPNSASHFQQLRTHTTVAQSKLNSNILLELARNIDEVAKHSLHV